MHVAVLGAGTMGHGIAQVAAMAGHDVWIRDVERDIVVEAVPEDVALKQDVLTDAEGLVGGEAVLATNTSSLSVTDIASALDSPERLVGLHFFNPVHIMALVEVVGTSGGRDGEYSDGPGDRR